MKNVRIPVLFFLLFSNLFFGACSVEFDDIEKQRDLSFTVVDERELPEELKERMEREKKEGFCLTFAEEEWLYLARGYGEKKTGGYSVEVTECYESANGVCLRTRLLGPSRGEEIPEGPAWPWVVVKVEYCDKNVLFL